MDKNIPTSKLTTDAGISSDTAGQPTSGAASSLNKAETGGTTGTASSKGTQGKSAMDKGLETMGNKMAGQGGVFGSMGQKMREMGGGKEGEQVSTPISMSQEKWLHE
ncbi:uncharacterized protein EI97DRAFT_431780 [Westerdykella ornata]|uniref:Uncharacterized protein n=1 Tax=Westerdykella ornata TaxID=318751 RepID=A0A6A6JR32_WESOR|nr:uncharacterized protein EI97DRAFT_431780 [Westerdykella ornata]KAF2278563.1 hypothetical protein EI97DRAFT_431780 [Westerdykella ornata]